MAHQPRGQGKEMGAILQRNIRLDQSQKRFVHHRGRLQRMAAAFGAHVAAGQTAQLVVDQRRQPLQRLRVTGAPFGQQLREIGRDLHRVLSSLQTKSGGRPRLQEFP